MDCWRSCVDAAKAKKAEGASIYALIILIIIINIINEQVIIIISHQLTSPDSTTTSTTVCFPVVWQCEQSQRITNTFLNCVSVSHRTQRIFTSYLPDYRPKWWSVTKMCDQRNCMHAGNKGYCFVKIPSIPDRHLILQRQHKAVFNFKLQQIMKKSSEKTQTLCDGCSKAEPKISPRRRPPSRGRGTAKIFNQLEMVNTFTYKPSLVRIDAHSFESSW